MDGSIDGATTLYQYKYKYKYINVDIEIEKRQTIQDYLNELVVA